MSDKKDPIRQYEDFLSVPENEFAAALEGLVFQRLDEPVHGKGGFTQVTLKHPESGEVERGMFPVRAPMDGKRALDWMFYRLAKKVADLP